MKTLKQIIAEEEHDSYRRVEALRGLIQLAATDEETFEYVLELKNDENVVFRHKWARLLSKIDDPRIAQVFMECLESETDTHTIKTMIRGIARSGDKSYAELLEPWLEAPSYSIRHAAKAAIEELLYTPEPETELIPEPEPEEPAKPKFPRHRLPWRLKLKFFYRKYKYWMLALVLLAAIYPVSLGTAAAVNGVKEIIASFKPTPEEIAERKRIEEERLAEQKRLEEERKKEEERKRLAEQKRIEEEKKRLAEQKRLEELKRLEEERKKKEAERLSGLKRLEEERKKKEALLKELAEEKLKAPSEKFNWGTILKIAVFLIICTGIYYIFAFLNKMRFGQRIEEFKRERDRFSSQKPSPSQTVRKKPKTPRQQVEEKLGTVKKKKAGPVNNVIRKAEKTALVRGSKKALFSFLDRVFRVNRTKAGSLKIFIPNELFYKIRFKTMMGCIKTLINWVAMFTFAFVLYILISDSFKFLDFGLLDKVTEPLKLGAVPMVIIVAVYGFFGADPSKARGINLYQTISDYFNANKSGMAMEEKEQWQILIRNVKTTEEDNKSTCLGFAFKEAFALCFTLIFFYYAYFPLIAHFMPFMHYEEIPMFQYYSPQRTGGKTAMFLIISVCIILPLILSFIIKAVAGSTAHLKQYNAKFSVDDEEREEEELKEAYEDIVIPVTEKQQAPQTSTAKQTSYIKNKIKSMKKTMEKPEGLSIICGDEKEAWLDSVLPEFRKLFPTFKFTVTYLNDKEASRFMDEKQGCYDVWIPDSLIGRDQYLKSNVTARSNYLPHKGCLLKTPMVYVFKKKVLKKFKEIYNNVNYRSLSDAKGKMRNLKGINFTFSQPHYNDMEIGTFALILMANEYFRTTMSFNVEELKNKVFKRSIREYFEGTKFQGSYQDTDAFVTTEKRALEFLSNPKNKGYQLVYPRLTLFMDHTYYILNESEAANFFFNYLISLKIQKNVSEFGWRAGNESVQQRNSQFMQKWKQYMVHDHLGVHSRPPSQQNIMHLLKSAEMAVKDVNTRD